MAALREEASLKYSDPEYVKGKDHGASKLNARIALHERFSTNGAGLFVACK